MSLSVLTNHNWRLTCNLGCNYRTQRSWGKVIFSNASVILSTGRGTAPGGCLLPGGCLVETPRDGYCCGRYASYWNAFLFWSLFICKSREPSPGLGKIGHKKMAAKRGHVDFMFRAPVPASGSATVFIMLRRKCCGTFRACLLDKSDINHIIKWPWHLSCSQSSLTSVLALLNDCTMWIFS